jgi:ADP-ribosylglycohydrolase
MNTSTVNLINAQRDRAVGVLVGTAAGDALGAGYEFDEPVAVDHPVAMIGGGLGLNTRGLVRLAEKIIDNGEITKSDAATRGGR